MRIPLTRTRCDELIRRMMARCGAAFPTSRLDDYWLTLDGCTVPQVIAAIERETSVMDRREVQGVWISDPPPPQAILDRVERLRETEQEARR